MKRLVLIPLLALAQPATAQPAAPADAATHQQLRAMKDRLVAALNAKQPAALLAELDPDVRLTTMDAVLSKGPGGAKTYYNRMMAGSTRIVRDMTLSATPDDLSTLYSDGRVAVTTGTARAHFVLTGGRTLDVPLRWTATSVNRDGTWKVAAAQFTANMFDNPVLSGAKTLAIWLAGGGLVVGLFLGWLLGRRKRKA